MARLKIQKNSKEGPTLQETYPFDNYLSMKSKGLLSLLYSLGTDITFSLDDLVSLCTDPKGAVRSSFRELQVLGYLERTMIRDQKGRYLTAEYTVRSIPRKRPIGGDLYC